MTNDLHKPLLPVADARARIFAACSPLSATTSTLTGLALAGQAPCLAAPLLSARAMPAFDNSAMDGYAVGADSLALDDDTGPVVRRVIGRSLAGQAQAPAIGVGEVVAITTGAPLPPNTVAVVMREDTDESVLNDGTITLRRRPAMNEHIRRRGDDVDVGTVVGSVGDVLTPARLNLLWSAGLVAAEVVRAPIVAILASGDELKQVGEALGDDDVVNSNAWAVAAACRALGCEVRLLGIATDTLDDHARLLRRAVDDDRGAADVVISIGGVSMGSHDFVRPALEQIGAELSVFKLAMRPGKPLAFGFMPSSSNVSSSSSSNASRALFFGLPGNPVSSLVTFELFVRPALRLLRGERRERVDVPRRRGVLGDATPFAKKKGLALFARATTQQREDGVVVVTTLDRQGSGQISGLANANALCCFAADAERIAAGDEVEFIELG